VVVVWEGSLLSPESSLTKIWMVSSGSAVERAEAEEDGLEERMMALWSSCGEV